MTAGAEPHPAVASGGAAAAVTDPDCLVVLDFSGTLSTGAAAFAAPERLRAELERSGLADLGIDSPEVFWDVLVTPTWERGSTTTVGYVTVLTAAAVDHLQVKDPPVDPAVVEGAVRRFADRYFASSAVDAAWGPWLRLLAVREDVALVVATDHYAEATQHITAALRTLDVEAVAVAAADPDDDTVILVANSADVGHHKRDRAFWRPLTEVLAAVDRVVVVDDFGAAEATGDAYAEPARIQRRRRRTTGLLGEVFDATVASVPFTVEPGTDVETAIDDAARAVLAIVTAPDRRKPDRDG